jgi:hypothetical protein
VGSRGHFSVVNGEVNVEKKTQLTLRISQDAFLGVLVPQVPGIRLLSWIAGVGPHYLMMLVVVLLSLLAVEHQALNKTDGSGNQQWLGKQS